MCDKIWKASSDELSSQLDGGRASLEAVASSTTIWRRHPCSETLRSPPYPLSRYAGPQPHYLERWVQQQNSIWPAWRPPGIYSLRSCILFSVKNASVTKLHTKSKHSTLLPWQGAPCQCKIRCFQLSIVPMIWAIEIVFVFSHSRSPAVNNSNYLSNRGWGT